MKKEKRKIDVEVQTINDSGHTVQVLSSFYLDSPLPFLKKPRNITFLAIAILFIAYVAFKDTQLRSPIEDISPEQMTEAAFLSKAKTGYFLMMGFLVFFCMIFMPDPIIYRPHPAFWRMVTGFGLCYLLTLLFFLCLSRDQLMLFFKVVVDSNLGKPLPERSYAEHCEIYTPYDSFSKFRNVRDSLDMYIAAHSLGWFFKMLIIRDWKMCMIMQVGFEFMELTFRHWLPNFHECWWDSVVFDVLVCNTCGIVAGHYFMRLFQMRKYGWLTAESFKNDHSFKKNVAQFFGSFEIFEQKWNSMSSTKHFYCNLVLIFVVNKQISQFRLLFETFQGIQNFSVELSHFFNKFVLWIPSNHFLLFTRIWIIVFLSIQNTREYYEYINREGVKRLGPNSFIGILIAVVEWLIFFKFLDPKQFEAPFPLWIKATWSLAFAALFLVTIGLLVKDFTNKKKKDQIEEPAVEVKASVSKGRK